MTARMGSNESASPSHHGRGEKMIVKNTFIDVFNEAESESDETGCASPHRRNNSAPPSPTRARGKMWDDQEVQSDQEEEDHDGGIPTYKGSLGGLDGYSSLQSAGTSLQKWVEMEVNAQEWDDKPANPLSPQAIRPRRKQADAWANAEASGGIDMTRPEFMSYFQGHAPALLSAGSPGDPRGANNRFEIDLVQEPEGMPPGGMGYTLSGGLGSHPLGLQGVEAGARRPSHEAGQGILSTMGLTHEPGFGPPDPAAALVDRMPHAAAYGRSGGYKNWGAPPQNYPSCAGGLSDPYAGVVPSPGYGVEQSYPLYPPPPPGPPFHDPPHISAPPPGPPRLDASARQEAQPRGRKPERQDLHHRLQQHPCPSDDHYPEVPAYLQAAAQEHQQQLHQQPLLSFPPPVPQSGTNVYSSQTNVSGGQQMLLRKGSGNEGRGSKGSDQMSAPQGKSGIPEGYSDPVHSKQAADLQHHRGSGGAGRGSKSSAGSGNNGPSLNNANSGKAAAQWGQAEVQGSNNKNGNPAGGGNSKHQQNNNEASKSGRSAPIGGGGGPKRTNYLSKYGGTTTLAETGTNSTEQQITTMMLKNIPCRKSQEEVMAHVDQQGYAGRYDFFYLPRDVKFRANLGYAFINFVTQDDALRFQSEMNGYRFAGSGSSKACTVVPAHVQGLMNNLAAFKRTEVMRSNRKPFFSGVVAL